MPFCAGSVFACVRVRVYANRLPPPCVDVKFAFRARPGHKCKYELLLRVYVTFTRLRSTSGSDVGGFPHAMPNISNCFCLI